MTSESCKFQLQDVFWNADNNNRESKYNQLSAAILTPSPLVLGYILVLATPLVPTDIRDSKAKCLIKIKVEGKVHPRTGHEGPEGEQKYSSTLSLTSELDGVGWLMPCPSHFTPLWERDPVLTVHKARWASGMVCTGVENFTSTRIQSPDRPARSKLLYQLSYPGTPY